MNGWHVFIYTKSNKLFSCGYNSKGQLGINGKKKQLINEIKYIKFKSNLKSIASGVCHSLFLLITGEVYGVGSNEDMQINFDKNIDGFDKITQIEKLSNIEEIQCCERSSYVLNKYGQLYSFGYNKYGELGQNKKNPKFGIGKVLIDSQVKFISAGGFHVWCMDKKNDIYVFGANDEAECGMGMDIGKISKPTKLLMDGNINVKSIACGHSHSIVKTMDDKYYSCGTNDDGECLIKSNDDEEYVWTLQLIDEIKKHVNNERIVKLIPGKSVTFIVTK